MARNLVAGKFPAKALVDPELWSYIRKKSVDLGVSASQLTELALRILKAFIELGYIPDDCAALESIDREALEELAQLARLARAIAEEPSFEVA